MPLDIFAAVQLYFFIKPLHRLRNWHRRRHGLPELTYAETLVTPVELPPLLLIGMLIASAAIGYVFAWLQLGD